MTVNTHQKYETIDHIHLDSLVNWALGDYPSSGLCLVECTNGNYFVEIDFGVEFDQVDGISKPNIEPYVDPVFFKEESLAEDFAIKIIKQVYPELIGRNLKEYFTEDETSGNIKT